MSTIMPFSFYQYLSKNLEILFPFRFDWSVFLFLISGHLLPIITMITYTFTGYFSIHNRNNQILLINKLLNKSKKIEISSNSANLRKSIILSISIYVAISTIITIKIRLEIFQSLLSLSYQYFIHLY